MESERNKKPPDVKLPSPRSLQCKVVNSTELLSGDQLVVVIAHGEEIHTSFLNMMPDQRKKTALSCETGWVFSGRLGPICVVLINPTGSQGGHVKDLLENLRPKAVFWVVFCSGSYDIYCAGDIFICNEVNTNEGLQNSHRGLNKLMEGLRYGWNPPGTCDQQVYSGSGQLCDNHCNGEQMKCSVDIQMATAVDVTTTFSCLKQNQIPWTVVCGVLPQIGVEQISKILQQWKLYVAETLASFMKEVFDTRDIFAALDPVEGENRIKSICPNAPSQEENSANSSIKSTVITEETVDTKDGATKSEFKESSQSKKYHVLPGNGKSKLPPIANTASNEDLRQEFIFSRADLLDFLSRFKTDDTIDESFAKLLLQRDKTESTNRKVKEPEQQNTDEDAKRTERNIFGRRLQPINSTPEDELLNKNSMSKYGEGQRTNEKNLDTEFGKSIKGSQERNLEAVAKISESPMEVAGNTANTKPKWNRGDAMRAMSENRNTFKKESFESRFGKTATMGDDGSVKPASKFRYASASAVRTSFPQSDRGNEHKESNGVAAPLPPLSDRERPKTSLLGARAKSYLHRK